MDKDRLYAKLIALSTIYEKSESCRQSYIERLKFRKGEHQKILNEIIDPQFRQWVKSIKPLLNVNSNKNKLYIR